MSHNDPTDRFMRLADAGDRPVYYDDCRGTYHVWYDKGEYEPVSTAVVFGVSSVLGKEPTRLQALRECIDPEALDALFGTQRPKESSSQERALSFTFSACAITVHHDGEIVIDPIQSEGQVS